MDGAKNIPTRPSLVLRWVARGWTILSLVFVTVTFVGQTLHPTGTLPLTARDVLGLLLFVLATCLGLVLAWRCEGLGVPSPLAASWPSMLRSS